MPLGRFLRDYFDMNRRERRGIFVLLGLLLCVLFARYTIIYWLPGQQVAFDLLPQSVPGSKPLSDTSRVTAGVLPGRGGVHSRHFSFDPNTAGRDTLLKLGLPEKVVSNILKYRQKGGQFRRHEDFKKIYDLDENLYAELKPYIRLEGLGLTGGAKGNATTGLTDLNSADSAVLVKVDGIGPVFAERIIRYRNALGGFYEKEQLKEVYGIGEEQYRQLVRQVQAKKAGLKKIHVNEADISSLSRHPYLSYKQAQAIVRYREQHGPYSTPQDLLKIKILDAALINKLEPYLAF